MLVTYRGTHRVATLTLATVPASRLWPHPRRLTALLTVHLPPPRPTSRNHSVRSLDDASATARRRLTVGSAMARVYRSDRPDGHGVRHPSTSAPSVPLPHKLSCNARLAGPLDPGRPCAAPQRPRFRQALPSLPIIRKALSSAAHCSLYCPVRPIHAMRSRPSYLVRHRQAC